MQSVAAVYLVSVDRQEILVIVVITLDRPPRWNLQRADWTLFESLCRDRLGTTELENRADPIGYFSTTLLSIAEESIPSTSSKARDSCKPWFNDDCKTAISDRKKALQAFSSNVNATNLSNLRVYRAKARRTIKLSKRNCWRSYVSKLNSQTPMKKIWSLIRRISGKPTTTPVNHLIVNGTTIEQPTEIANTRFNHLPQ